MMKGTRLNMLVALLAIVLGIAICSVTERRILCFWVYLAEVLGIAIFLFGIVLACWTIIRWL
jgi:hypothetical protein